ncbi:hypothetical protein [Variovorax sp. dw_308]|uniref:hypothetical protein n=1 Tax=Variovorax sp. dw_308 TaxID=2721546 RepID=UPI001C49619C|nr:hypothetical protein [Variovorax sp. dw_308]
MNDLAPSWPLWAGVVAIGIYHGLNPAMGWPLAVARGLDQKRGAAVFGSWMPLGAGHLLAMAIVLVPFAVLAWLLQWSREIRIVVGALVLLFGIAQLVLPQRHRRLARIKPTQLALWSFLMATAHGAALMLLPILMGLCDAPAATTASVGLLDHGNVMDLMRTSLGTAVVVSLVHTAAMIGSGLSAAWIVYRYLGLRALRTAWLNLEKVWALGLIASGGAAVMTALAMTGTSAS